MKKLLRFAKIKILQSLKAFPVTYIAGPRQSGKTTLAQGIASGIYPLHYFTFDDLQLQSAAQHDPDAFHQGLVVYQGNDVLSFGKNMWAIPFAKLWS